MADVGLLEHTKLTLIAFEIALQPLLEVVYLGDALGDSVTSRLT